MITQHPEVERKVLAELDAHGLLVTPARPNPRSLEWDDLGKLTYTNNCIKVAMFSILSALMDSVLSRPAAPLSVTGKPKQDQPALSASENLSLVHMLFAGSRLLIDVVCFACHSAPCSARRNPCG